MKLIYLFFVVIIGIVTVFIIYINKKDDEIEKKDLVNIKKSI